MKQNPDTVMGIGSIDYDPHPPCLNTRHGVLSWCLLWWYPLLELCLGTSCSTYNPAFYWYAMRDGSSVWASVTHVGNSNGAWGIWLYPVWQLWSFRTWTRGLKVYLYLSFLSASSLFHTFSHSLNSLPFK